MSLSFVVLSWNSCVRHDVLEMVGTWSWFGDLGIWYSSHWEMTPFPMSSETYGYFFCSASLPCNTIQSIKSLNSEHLYLFLLQVTFCFPWDYCFPNILGKVVLVFSRSAVSDSVTPWTAACQASLSFTISWVCSDSCPLSQWCHQPSHPLSPLLLLPSIFSSISVFSTESALHIKWPKYWNFSFSISPSNEYSGLISFGIDWFDLLAVEGTLKSLLQHHSSKASILWSSVFYIVQFSHPYVTTEKRFCSDSSLIHLKSIWFLNYGLLKV